MQDTEVPLVECQDVVHAVPLGEDDDRSVGEANPQIRVVFDHSASGRDVGGREGRERVGAGIDVGEESKSRPLSDPLPQHVVELGEDEWREDEWRLGLFERTDALVVSSLSIGKCALF
jgi:hypothetical protein